MPPATILGNSGPDPNLPSRYVVRQIHLDLSPKVLPSRRQTLHRHTQRNGDEPIHNAIVGIMELNVEGLDTGSTTACPCEQVLLAENPGVLLGGMGDGPVNRR